MNQASASSDPPAGDLSPLGARLASALRASRGSKVPLEVLRDAALEADLSLAGSPDGRARIASAIGELAAAGALNLPKGDGGWDRAVAPPLPRYVTKPAAPRGARRRAARLTWHAALGWAAIGGWTPDEELLLRKVNDWLIAGGARRTVPLQERSLELLDDEKALGRFMRGGLFSPGRLTLELLGAVRASPPFVYSRTGSGPYALVAENSATYRTFVEALAGGESPVGLVVFGGGNGFVRSVEFFADLVESGSLRPIREIRYFGDLDAEGLKIPVGAARQAAEFGLPPILPAVGLYRRLLDHGRPGPDAPVGPVAAAALVAWLPDELADRAAAVLVNGQRLAQEAVGADLLAGQDWASAAELGIAPRPPAGMLRRPGLPVAEAALVSADDGIEQVPASDADWDAWVSAGRTRNYALGDPLLDWLGRHGRAHGLVPDTERTGYDERTDFARFVMTKGAEFEAGVVRLLAEREEIVWIGSGWQDARSVERAEATIAAMRAGRPIIAQGVLRNPANGTYGMPDLLVRSDVLARLFPDSVDYEEAHVGAPGLGLAHSHYLVVDIKFHTFELTVDGAAAGDVDSLPYLIQTWIYNEALGRITGYAPPASYLLGRTWTSGAERGAGCLERLARVDHGRILQRRGVALAELAAAAVAWVRRMRAEGDRWEVLPRPTVLELYPHARNSEDAPWHAAKGEIAAALRELTLLPRMNPARRADALARGIASWDDPAASAVALGITEPAGAALCDAVLEANRVAIPSVLPDRIVRADPSWRRVPIREFYVDFETTSSLDDDFTALPTVGGQPLIFQIGCGYVADGHWTFAQWTAGRITVADEGRLIDDWLAHMAAVAAAAGRTLADARIVHYSAAEPVNLETAYNAARTRHPEATLPTELPWFDLLAEVIRAEPVTVTGAFNFGLKSIARALHAQGAIPTVWGDGPTDGLGAMVGAWWCNAEAIRMGVPMGEIELMREIAAYNEVDCRAMADVLAWLRANR